MIGTIGVPVTVPTPGTPVRPIDLMVPAPRDGHVAVHGIMFQVLPTNTGLIYVGRAGLNKTTLAQVFAVLGAPTSSPPAVPTVIPVFSAALTLAPNALTLEQFWVDADEAGDGVLVTYLQT